MRPNDTVSPIVGAPEALARMRAAYASLPKTEKRAARYVLDHPDEVIHAPIAMLAQRAGVSEATVVRLCQRLGYRGYPNFRIYLARDLGRPYEDSYQDLTETSRPSMIARQVFDLSIRALADTLAGLDMAAFEAATQAMSRAGTIFLYGVGGSGEAARIAHHRVLRAGVPCQACTDPHLQAFVAASTRPGDAALGISYSGGSDDVTRALAISRDRGATTICLVSLARSPVARVSHIVLLAGGVTETEISEPQTARIVQIVVLDALCACVTALHSSHTSSTDG